MAEEDIFDKKKKAPKKMPAREARLAEARAELKKAKDQLRRLDEPPGHEIEIWRVPNYRITYDKDFSEMVYRVRIPVERLQAIGV